MSDKSLDLKQFISRIILDWFKIIKRNLHDTRAIIHI